MEFWLCLLSFLCVWYECVCVCVCVCTRAHVCVLVCVCMRMHAYMLVCVCVCVFARSRVCTCPVCFSLSLCLSTCYILGKQYVGKHFCCNWLLTAVLKLKINTKTNHIVFLSLSPTLSYTSIDTHTLSRSFSLTQHQCKCLQPLGNMYA